MGNNTLEPDEAAILDGALAATTRDIYGRDLHYVAMWHKFTFGADLPWPAPEELFVRFIIDASNGPKPDVDEKLRARGLKQRPGGVGASVIRRRVAAWRHAHCVRGLAHSGVSERIERLLRAVKRRGGAPRMTPGISRDDLQKACDQCDGSLAGRRDKALLLLGFAAGGRRRSELASIRIEDLTEKEVGGADLGVFALKRGRGDMRVNVPPEASKAVRDWVEAAGLASGPMFRSIDKKGRLGPGLSPAGIRLVLKRRFAQAGLPDELTAHSLRAGYVTEAMGAGVSLGEIMGATGHRSVSACVRYYRPGL